jgi:hypothetical protein
MNYAILVSILAAVGVATDPSESFYLTIDPTIHDLRLIYRWDNFFREELVLRVKYSGEIPPDVRTARRIRFDTVDISSGVGPTDVTLEDMLARLEPTHGFRRTLICAHDDSGILGGYFMAAPSVCDVERTCAGVVDIGLRIRDAIREGLYEVTEQYSK